MGSVDVIGSQLDVASIVGQLMQLERLPVYNMEDQITSMQKKVTAYQDLNTKLSALANKVNMLLYGSTTAPILKPGNFNQRMAASIFTARTATSSNENVLTGSASGTMTSGSYSIAVSQLAKAQTSVSNAFQSANDDVGEVKGKITFGLGTNTKIIEIDLKKQERIIASGKFGDTNSTQLGAGTVKINDTEIDAEGLTLEGLRDAINSSAAGAKVNAEIVSDDGGYRLKISSLSAGTENAFSISITDKDENLSLGKQLGFTQTQAAKDTTLRDLQDVINEAATKEGINIKASIINAGAVSGNGLEGGYRLMITSKETGTANSFTFTGDLNGPSRIGFDTMLNGQVTQGQVAQDAKLTINGVSITSSSNNVKDVIEGVTINLKNITKDEETVKLEIGVDNDAVVSAVKDMVAAYNAVSSFINGQFSYTTTTTTDSLGQQKTSIASYGVLSGDATLRSIQSSLQSSLSGGLTGTDYSFRSISQLGLTYEKDGSLSLDETKLKEALSKDFDAVAGFFLGYDKTVDDGNGGEKTVKVGGVFTNMGESLKGLTDPLRNPIKNALSGLDSNIRNLQQSIEAYELRLQTKEDLLYAQFSAADEALRLMRVTLGNISGALASLTNNSN